MDEMQSSCIKIKQSTTGKGQSFLVPPLTLLPKDICALIPGGVALELSFKAKTTLRQETPDFLAGYKSEAQLTSQAQYSRKHCLVGAAQFNSERSKLA